MQCKEFEAAIEQSGYAELPPAARAHLTGCAGCQNFFADLSAITALAAELPAEVEPPNRIWVSVKAQLSAEGVIRPAEAAFGAAEPTFWEKLSGLMRPRVLAPAGLTIAVAIAAVIGYYQPTKGPVVEEPAAAKANLATAPAPARTETASNAPVAAGASAQKDTRAAGTTAAAKPSRANGTAQTVAAIPRAAARDTAAQPAASSTTEFRPSPSDSLYGSTAAALNAAEMDADGPSLRGNVEVDQALRKNLRMLNEFIADCEKHLKQYPNDALAREYLANAYRQKAELLTAILDNGRSVQ